MCVRLPLEELRHSAALPSPQTENKCQCGRAHASTGENIADPPGWGVFVTPEDRRIDTLSHTHTHTDKSKPARHTPPPPSFLDTDKPENGGERGASWCVGERY